MVRSATSTICGLGLLLLSTAAAAQVVQIPSAIDAGARFAADGADGRLVARGGSGACAVVHGGVVVTAADGASLRPCTGDDCEERELQLLGGGFRLQVGSEQMVFVLGETTVAAAGADLVVELTGAGWAVLVERLEDAGQVQVHRTESVADTAAGRDGAGEGAARPATTAALELREGMAVVITAVAGGWRLDAHRRLAALGRRLRDPAPAGPQAQLEDVERPEDLIASRAGREDAIEDIEIEEIEIEAGCVEVCLD